MNKVNYQKLADEEIEKVKASGKRPTMLLHACCAPCASYCVEYLKDYFDITLFYYNPNIYPQDEYEKRLENLQKLAKYFGVKVIEGEYEPKEYYEKVKGFEKEKEGGARCRICTALRIEQTAKLAKLNNFDYYCTTLSISPLKDAESLNKQGEEFSNIYGIKYFYSDFKKKGGYLRSIELCKQLDIYRQHYCGCVFAK